MDRSNREMMWGAVWRGLRNMEYLEIRGVEVECCSCSAGEGLSLFFLMDMSNGHVNWLNLHNTLAKLIRFLSFYNTLKTNKDEFAPCAESERKKV